MTTLGKIQPLTIERFHLRGFEHLIGKGWYMITGFCPVIFRFTGSDDEFPKMESLKAVGEDMAVGFFTYSQGLRTIEIGYYWDCICVDDLIEGNRIISSKKVADRYNILLGKYLTERNREKYTSIKEWFPNNI